MAINLDKGSSINLNKSAPSLKKLRLGLGWDLLTNGAPLDLDASVFICKYDNKQQPKLISDEHFVFYNNLQCPYNAVIHDGDNRTGDGDGDDEVIHINLADINPAAQELSVFVTIHNANGRTFSSVSNSYINLYNEQTGDLIAEYNLGQSFSDETSVQVGSLVKDNGEWIFHAVGAGYQLGLGDIVAGYQ
ncbi:TerD family protein [Vibrio profundum]|uniref:TerD family protein n=1 Tax=Vibrio profundum TaxID=2910247 RepID=UPI003D0FEFC8